MRMESMKQKRIVSYKTNKGVCAPYYLVEFADGRREILSHLIIDKRLLADYEKKIYGLK